MIINTAEDIIRAMDENPEWLEAVRQRVLTRELLELPQKLERFIEVAERRFAALEAGQTRLETRQTELEATLRQFMENTDRRFQKLDDDVGVIKGFHARSVFTKRAKFLVQRRMGLKVRRTLSDDDILNILSEADTSGVDQEDIESFEDADAVVRVTDSEDAQSFVAVEVSYTVHTDDVNRASTNARLLAEWTGIPARAAVAGTELHPVAWEACRETGTEYLRIRSNSLRGT